MHVMPEEAREIVEMYFNVGLKEGPAKFSVFFSHSLQ